MEKILQRHKCHPYAEMAKICMERGADGEYVLDPKTRAAYLSRLMDFWQSKPKPHEARSTADSRPIINITQTFPASDTTPEPEVPRIALNDAIDPPD